MATVKSAGSVTIRNLGFDLGIPSALAWGPAGGSFEGKLFVADVGSRETNGALTSGSGRILVVDGTTGVVSTFATGLDAPVAIGFPEASGFRGCVPTDPCLFVLAAGSVDATTGKLDPGSGTLRAYDASAVATLLIEDLDVPYGFAFRTSNKLVIGSTVGLTEFVSSGTESAVPGLVPMAGSLLFVLLAVAGTLQLTRGRARA